MGRSESTLGAGSCSLCGCSNHPVWPRPSAGRHPEPCEADREDWHRRHRGSREVSCPLASDQFAGTSSAILMLLHQTPGTYQLFFYVPSLSLLSSLTPLNLEGGPTLSGVAFFFVSFIEHLLGGRDCTELYRHTKGKEITDTPKGRRNTPALRMCKC